ncbi:MAG TPA: VCBS repeat-containing protein [Verrucomicrobiales bacterium]|nr:VCBS repeat-containing protein [Verrucomicrobiales bacterium]
MRCRSLVWRRISIWPALLALALGGFVAPAAAQDPIEPRPEIPDTGEEVPDHSSDTFEGWETEAVADDAKHQLDILRAYCQDPAARAAFDSAALAAPSFTATPLRPSELLDIRVGASFAIRRLQDGVRLDPLEGQGPALLTEALDELLSAFAPGTPLRTLIKITGVSLSRDLATTSVFFHIHGPAADQGLREINGAWSCDWPAAADGHPQLLSLRLVAFEETTYVNPRGTLFSDCTEAVFAGDPSFEFQLRHGLDHWLARIDSRLGLVVGGWNGLAIGDADGDGLDDLYLCQPAGLPNLLYLQQPDGVLRDASAGSGVDWIDSTTAALWVDLDNDGDQDLVVALPQGLMFHENTGRGVFAVRRAEVLTGGIPYSLAAADYDRDGNLDLFASCYNRRGLDRNRSLARPVPYHDANNGGRNVLLRNEGGFVFRHVTRETGLDVNNERYSYAATWDDYDNDGDLDLYVANDFGRNNLYRQDPAPGGGVRFTDVAEQAGVLDIAAGMSAAWGDYDNDGFMDLYVGNMFSSAGNRIATQDQFLAGSNPDTRSLFLRHARGNSLFRNRGPDSKGAFLFDDLSVESAVTLGRWAWGSIFCDLNNDGREDILVANGFITQPDTGDL